MLITMETRSTLVFSVRSSSIWDSMAMNIRKIIEGIQRNAHEGCSHAGLRTLEPNLQQELQRIMCQEEITWFHRTKDKWSAVGDRNMCFYHVKVFQRREEESMFRLSRMLKGSGYKTIEINNSFKENFHNFYTRIKVINLRLRKG